LDVTELAKLDGYLEAISNLLDDEMHGADTEGELFDFWMDVSRLQVKVGNRQVAKSASAVIQQLTNR
jgi:hypothetical protein